MFVVEVIPIKKGFGKEWLSYFSAEKIAPGSIVKVPLRGKDVWGIVASITLAVAQKTELKNSSFVLKKITSNQKRILDEWWIGAIYKIAEYFAATVGSVMSVFVPAIILENIQKFASPVVVRKTQKRSQNRKINIKNEILCIQTDDEERWSYYKSAIREEFAKKHSVFLLLPTIEDIKIAALHFKKGIEQYTYTYHSDIKDLDLLDRWNDCLREEHPVLIIATSRWLLIPRSDLGTIILDKENSQSYRTLGRPYIDIRKAVEFFAKERGSRLIVGDSMLRVETIWRYKNDEIFAFEPIKFRLGSTAETDIISMKTTDNGSKIISRKLAALIESTKEESKNMFVYATRKGLSSITICSDCGREVLCHNCFSPMILYKANSETKFPSEKNLVSKSNFFRCHQCSSIRSAKELCKKCGSWRLQPLGVGIERVVQELRELIPKANILSISSDTATAAKASKTAEKFYKTPGSILVGTEMAIYHLKNMVDFTAVASIDSLFSVPDYKIREKIFHIILNLKLLAREKCLVQMRNAERNTIELALAGNILDFYKMEIEERELLQYPPFGVFVKITVRGNRVSAEKESKFLEQFLEKWNPVVFESIAERRNARLAFNCVIKMPRNEWPQPELLQKILSLPPNFEVKINPDSLL